MPFNTPFNASGHGLTPLGYSYAAGECSGKAKSRTYDCLLANHHIGRRFPNSG
jgi:hypothetical protein